MNGISHKQAIQWIHRRLDGLLSESQLSSLEEHIRNCDSCRTYAINMDGFAAHLQNEFHRRWDEKPGPSQNVMKQVTAKAKRIPVANRISSGAKLLAGAMTLIVLAVAINFVVSRLQSTSPVANSTESGNNTLRPEYRLLAFTSVQNGNADIYTIHADGSGLTNITNHPGYDSNPFWSPDGKRIAFERDQDGFKQIYMMYADGSNLIQLTNDEAHHYLPTNIDGISNPWSPDGSKLLFLQSEPEMETSTLYSIDIDGGNTVTFASGNFSHSGLSWSPNGNYIGYVRNTSLTPDATFEPNIYIADATARNVISVNELIPQNESINNPFYSWSRDGNSMIFTARRHLDEGKDQWIAYEVSLVDARLTERATSSGHIEDWWEGTSFIRGLSALSLTWLRADGTFNTLEPLEICQSTADSQHGFVAKRSPNGNQIVNVICPNNEMRFYYVNPDATVIKPLLDSPIPSFAVDNSITNMVWSPDDQFVALTLVSPTKSSLYILNVQDNSKSEEIVLSDSELYIAPSWQPVVEENLAKDVPTPQPPSNSPSNRLIAFASDQNGNFDIYTIRADGSGLTNITNNPAMDANPIWSPDGKRIAFESDRDGSRQIYVMDSDGSNVFQLANGQGENILIHHRNEFSPWSPDGTSLLIGEQLSGEENWKLYVLDVKEGHKTLLGDESNRFTPISWSPNGQQVALLVVDLQDPYQNHLYIINRDGSDLREITASIRQNEPLVFTQDYHWSPDGQSFFFVALTDSGYWTAYEARLDDDSLIEHAITTDRMYGWWNGIYMVNNSSASAPFEWVRQDRTSSKLNPKEKCQNIDLYQSDDTAMRSPNGNWVVTGQCANGDTWLYWANSDGTQIKLLLNSAISITNTFLLPVSWSEDDRFVAFSASSSNENDLYILNVSEALNSQAIQPVKISKSDALSWQPVSSREVVEEEPTPEPTPSPLAFSLTVQEAEELAGFDVLVPTYLPEGFKLEGADYNSQSHVVTLRYTSLLGDSLNTGTINIHQKRGDFPDFSKQLGLPSQSHATPVPIGNMTGEFTRGAWVYDSPDTTIPRWEESADYYSLSWQNDGMSFIVDFLGDHGSPPILLDELVAIAESLKSKPTAQQFPSIGTNKLNGEWIAFIGGEAVPDPIPVNQDVYMIHPDGTGLVNLTQSPAYYYYLQWSPDGQHLIFIRNTSDNKTEIMMHHVGETSPEVLASTVFYPVEYTPNTYFKYSWSPDSKQIAFLDKPAGNYDIYTINADGSDEPELRQLTNDPGQEIDFAWSPDGSQIAYQKTNGEQLSIMVMNADGSNQREVARGKDQVQLLWSQDGATIYASSVENNWLECEGCVAKPSIYRIDLDGPSVHQIYYEENGDQVAGWYLYDTPQGALYFMRVSPPNFVEFWGTWFRAEGDSVTEIGEMDPQQACNANTGNILNEHISPNPRFSVISNFCAGGFDLYLADREATPEKRFVHLLQLPLDTEGQGGDFATLPVMWSPDGRWLSFDAGYGRLYLLDLEKAIREPETALFPLIEPKIFESIADQLVVPSEIVIFWEVVWQPKH
jgi:Tol biopolymer transport system component